MRFGALLAAASNAMTLEALARAGRDAELAPIADGERCYLAELIERRAVALALTDDTGREVWPAPAQPTPGDAP